MDDYSHFFEAAGGARQGDGTGTTQGPHGAGSSRRGPKRTGTACRIHKTPWLLVLLDAVSLDGILQLLILI